MRGRGRCAPAGGTPCGWCQRRGLQSASHSRSVCSQRFMKRIILITGANGGLGQAIARAFVMESQDNFIWLGVRSGRARADELAAEYPDRCLCLELDVTLRDSWQQAVGMILGQHQRL